MKKLTLTVIIAALMMSCGGKKANTELQEDLPKQSGEVVDQAFVDEHNARNSLDYEGTYRGTLPTASGEGMEVTIIVQDSTYSKSVSYVGKMTAAVVEEGKYAWDSKGTTITLEGTDAPNQYFVAENALIQLDIEGKRIEGELASQYRLEKAE